MNSRKILTMMGFALSLLSAASSFGAELPADYEISLHGMTATDGWETQAYSFDGKMYSGGRVEMTVKFHAVKDTPEFTITLPQDCDTKIWNGIVPSGVSAPGITHYEIEFKLCDLTGAPIEGVLHGLDKFNPRLALPLVCHLSAKGAETCELGTLAAIEDRSTLVQLNTTGAPRPITIKRIEK